MHPLQKVGISTFASQLIAVRDEFSRFETVFETISSERDPAETPNAQDSPEIGRSPPNGFAGAFQILAKIRVNDENS